MNKENSKTAFIATNSAVVGDVRLGENSSVWYSATLRGDIAPVIVGKGSNIQDNAVLHVAHDKPCVIGDYVTVGHGAIIHACKVGNGTLVGMGSIILDDAEIGEQSIVAAGALVTQGKKFPPGSLIVGSPARVIRKLTDVEIDKLHQSALNYIQYAQDAAEKEDG